MSFIFGTTESESAKHPVKNGREGTEHVRGLFFAPPVEKCWALFLLERKGAHTIGWFGGWERQFSFATTSGCHSIMVNSIAFVDKMVSREGKKIPKKLVLFGLFF